jgi:THO complex subunit 1
VFIFVFKSFPLGDKSSVNRHGDFNIDNVTTFEELSNQIATNGDTANKDPDTMDTSADATAESEVKEDDKDSANATSTEALYPVFWGMQTSFAYPPQILQTEAFAGFKESFEKTLATLKSVPKLLSSNGSDRDRVPKRDIDDVEKDDFVAGLNPKYLTSRELFDLEASISAFELNC